jgi:hypothetical protein
MILHKAGYLLTVSSWENDLSNKNTTQHHYTDKTKVQQAVEFCKLFTKSYRAHDDSVFVGNVYDANQLQRARFEDIFYNFHLSNKGFIDEDPSETAPPPDLICDWCLDIAYDFGLTGTSFYTRMCSKIAVIYFKEDVHSEDVTSDFMG